MTDGEGAPEDTWLEGLDATTVLRGQSDWIGPEGRRALARHPLDSLETEFPHYVGSTDGPDGPPRPADQHPVFYGCFDWHSAVHSHWCLVRQLRLFDEHPAESAIVESIDARLTPSNVEREVAYFDEHGSFEKPYGWAWLLRLAAELDLWESDRGGDWRTVLRPLETTVVDLVETEFLAQDRPFRVGTHQNSAFALQAILDYAHVAEDESLAGSARETATGWFAGDEDWPLGYEPFGWDFLSPALAEADLLRRVLAPEAFDEWLAGFLPDLAAGTPEVPLEPVEVDADPDEGVALHLVGLNLSRAWALAGVATALDDERRAAFEASAERHAMAGLRRAFTGDYAGAHWLTSFVVYLLTRNEGGVGPGSA